MTINNITKATSKVLKKMNAPTGVRGFVFTVEVVNMLFDDMYNVHLTSEAYPAIAKKYDTSVANICRAIRHLVSRVRVLCDESVWEEVIGYYMGSTISNLDFITSIILYLQMDEGITREE